MNIKNQRGSITVDFIFAFVLIMGLGGILLALSLTLTVSSITQYVTFAAARSYNAAHNRTQNQRDLASQKFNALVSNPVLQPLFRNGWFEVSPIIPSNENVGEQIFQIFPEYAQGGNIQFNKFMGVGATFNARMLNFEIPFFGSTTDQEDGFTTFIASYLNIEPSANQCQSFNASRWEAIRNIDVQDGASYSTSTTPRNYAVISDNGC